MEKKKVLDFECLLKGFEPKDYVKAERLGLGGQGVVFQFNRKEATANSSLPDSVAFKNIQIRRPNGDDTREYQVLKNCDHPNVLKLFYWQLVMVPHDANHLFLYTELCDFNLKAFKESRELSIQDIKTFSRQMLSGCEHLHTKLFVHRDIKPENILVNCKGENLENVTYKIGDFGLARFVPADASSITALGTKRYASPETILAFKKNSCSVVKPNISFATDIFSLGVVIYEMITQKVPFVESELVQPEFDVESVIDKTLLPKDVSKLLSQMLQWDPELRSDAKQLLKLEAAMTQQSILSRQLRAQSHHMEKVNELDIFKLPAVRIHKNTNGSIRHYSIGNSHHDHSKPCKTILMSGMTGAGKSVMINSIVNYVYGVTFEDEFRFKLISEESGSRWINTYTLHYQEGFGVNYSLTIIDVPRLSDGGSQESGEKTAICLKELFSDDTYAIKDISSILLVIPASASKLSDEQKFLFNPSRNIFGNDVTKNICLMITFADSQEPPALHTLRRASIPFPEEKVCKFTNPVVYAKSDEAAQSSWKSAVKTLKDFFSDLEKAEIVRCTSSKEDIRKSFQGLLDNLKGKIGEGLDALEQIENLASLIKEGAIAAAKKRGTMRRSSQVSSLSTHTSTVGTASLTVKHFQKWLTDYQAQKMDVLGYIQQACYPAGRLYQIPKETSVLCYFLEMLINEEKEMGIGDQSTSSRVTILEHFRDNAELLQGAKDVSVFFLGHQMTAQEMEVMKAIDMEMGLGFN